MTAGKRSKVDIYSAVLDCICEEGGKLGKASPTRVAHRANIPYDRFQKILEHLINTQMVTRTDEGLGISEKGLKCLNQINQTNEFLRRMGLLI
ncbi:MAG TPA: winged helix-turn-helix domain-containing protein [Candidatus Acidoferrales bacterium]|nr:winged helix-turn-helix domain-containing protein [Candidatus Acidoferrales bacterium]